MIHILFVCTANQFRSPLAAELFQAESERRGDAASIETASAGTWAVNGKPLPEVTLQAWRTLQLTGLLDHRTRQIDAENLGWADLVVVMEANQREAIRSEFPSAGQKTFLLTELSVDRCYDIPDPAKTDVPVDEIAAELAGYIRGGYEKILLKARELSAGTGESK